MEKTGVHDTGTQREEGKADRSTDGMQTGYSGPVGKGTSWIPTVCVETCLRLGPEVVSHLGAAPTPGPVVTQATLSFAY